jgi:hypothetical protein
MEVLDKNTSEYENEEETRENPVCIPCFSFDSYRCESSIPMIQKTRHWLIQAYNDCYYRQDSQYIRHDFKEVDPEEERYIAGIQNP